MTISTDIFLPCALSADLLALLSRRETVIMELLHLNGLGRIVGQLQTGDMHLTQVWGRGVGARTRMKWVDFQVLNSKDRSMNESSSITSNACSRCSALYVTSQQMWRRLWRCSTWGSSRCWPPSWVQQYGRWRLMPEATASQGHRNGSPSYRLAGWLVGWLVGWFCNSLRRQFASISPSMSCSQLTCTALTRIAEDDEMAYQIRQCNCVTLLGKLLLAQPAPSQGDHNQLFADNDNIF